MNSQKGVKSGVPERASISCPTCGTRHDLPKITGNQSFWGKLYLCGENCIPHISILYKFQIDISSISREIKYKNIAGHTDTQTDKVKTIPVTFSFHIWTSCCRKIPELENNHPRTPRISQVNLIKSSGNFYLGPGD